MASLNDLEPLYETECDIHFKIIFCKNTKKGGKVFKYKIDNDTKSWQLVQCLCCQFEEKSMNEEWINSIKQQMDIDKSIDETNNRLSIQPFFSRFCENTQKISVFASVWPQMNTILAWNFDIEKETFVRSKCSKECCQEIVYPNDMTPPSVFDYGAQGKQFARYHRDSCKRQLMCLSITWNDNQNGQMEYFLDSEGEISRYEWKKNGNFFEFVELLGIKTLSYKHSEEVDKKQSFQLRRDLNFILLETKKCETLDEVLYFCYSRYVSEEQEAKIEKFIFDPINLQFCRIECPCCTTSKDKTSKMDAHLTISTYDSCITDTKVSIQTNCHGSVEKVITKPCGSNVTLMPSPIRNYSHLSPEEFKCHRNIEEKTPKMSQVFQKKETKFAQSYLTEAWIIRRNQLASDGVTNMITYVYMDGSVIEKEEQMENVENILRTEPNETIMEIIGTYTRFKDRQNGKVTDENLVTDYDLIPKYRNYCNHTDHFIITSFNNKTKDTGHYVFNPETSQFHHSEYCQECPSYDKGYKIQSRKTIMPAENPKSKHPYLIRTNADGRLVRIGFDSGFVTCYQLSSSEIGKKVDNINEIRYSLRAENSLEIPTFQQPPLDTDLTPKYKFYCEHINEFIIKALNNHTKTRGFYFFNSITGHLEQLKSCPDCSHKVRNILIKPMTIIMSVMSPYSKWPITLSTDKSGKLVSVYFQSGSNSFDRMPSLSINMRHKKQVNLSTIDEEIFSDEEEEWSDEEDNEMQNPIESVDNKKDNNEDKGEKTDEKDSSEQLFSVRDLILKYYNFCNHTGHFIITALNSRVKCFDHYIFNPETVQFHHSDYCQKCPSYENGVRIQPQEAVMTFEDPKSKYPYWIFTTNTGRLALIQYNLKTKRSSFVDFSLYIQKKVKNMNEIRHSFRVDDTIEIPISQQFPLDTDLSPKYFFHCPHINDFIINAYYNNTRGFYHFNSTTGHLDRTTDCRKCSHENKYSRIKPLDKFMSVMSPYSKWPFMLSTDESGKLVSLGFQPETNKFEKMSPLSINMKRKQKVEPDNSKINENVSEEAENKDDSKSIANGPSSIDDDQNSIASDFSYLKSDFDSELPEQNDSEQYSGVESASTDYKSTCIIL